MDVSRNDFPLFTDQPNRTSSLQTFAIIILFSFPGVALVIVTIRAAGRWSSRQFGWDDGLICLAMFLSLIETLSSYQYIKTNYIGIRLRDVPLHDPTEGLIWNYVVQILYNPILALVKTSVLIFLYKLFGQKRGVRAYVIGLSAVNLLQMVAVLFAIIFQCTPIAFNWDLEIPGGRCVDQPALYVSTATFTIITDVLVLALPAYIFRDLKIPKKTKLALLVVFLLGILVTAASIARLFILVVGLYNLVPAPEPTYNIGFVTSAIETNLALITASGPALMPLLRTWFPRLFGPDSSATATPRKVPLRDMQNRLELRGQTPRYSEEQVMTSNGIAQASSIAFARSDDAQFGGNGQYLSQGRRF